MTGDLRRICEAALAEFAQREAPLPPGFNIMPHLEALKEAIVKKLEEELMA